MDYENLRYKILTKNKNELKFNFLKQKNQSLRPQDENPFRKLNSNTFSNKINMPIINQESIKTYSKKMPYKVTKPVDLGSKSYSMDRFDVNSQRNLASSKLNLNSRGSMDREIMNQSYGNTFDQNYKLKMSVNAESAIKDASIKNIQKLYSTSN